MVYQVKYILFLNLKHISRRFENLLQRLECLAVYYIRTERFVIGFEQSFYFPKHTEYIVVTEYVFP